MGVGRICRKNIHGCVWSVSPTPPAFIRQVVIRYSHSSNTMPSTSCMDISHHMPVDRHPWAETCKRESILRCMWPQSSIRIPDVVWKVRLNRAQSSHEAVQTVLHLIRLPKILCQAADNQMMIIEMMSNSLAVPIICHLTPSNFKLCKWFPSWTKCTSFPC